MKRTFISNSLILIIMLIIGALVSLFDCFNYSKTQTTFDELCRFEGKCLNCIGGGCDDMCEFYDNKCCTNSSLENSKLEKWQYSCVRRYPDMYDLNLDCRGSFQGVYGVYMVDKCANLWLDDAIRAKCESPDKDLISSIPVYDKKNERVTFQNMYCAFCNRQVLQNLRFWKFDHFCDDNDQNKTEYESNFVTESCFIRLVNKHHKMCPFNVIETCSDIKEVKLSIKERCENGLLQNVYVWKYGNVFSIYKNEFCALCNGETGALQCWAFQAFTCWPQDLPSYTKIQAKVELELYWHDSSTSKPVFNSSCGYGVLFDPFRQSCLNVTCLLSIDTCVSGICNFVEISTADFEIRNNSLHLMALETVIEKGRYFPGVSATQVCLNDEQFIKFKMIQETTQQVSNAVFTNTSCCIFQIHLIFAMIILNIFVFAFVQRLKTQF